MLPPSHTRPDAAAAVVEQLNQQAPGCNAMLSVDATLNPNVVTTLVDVISCAPTTRTTWNRMLYRCSISVVVIGPNYDAVADMSETVQSVILSLTSAKNVDVSSVVCDSEPLRIAYHVPSEAQRMASTYTLIFRGRRT